MGRRARKTLYTYSSGSWQKQKEISFIYDGWNMVKESEKASDSSPEVPTYYVWGLDLSQSMQGAGCVGGLIASVKSGNEYLYSYDANGNVGQMVKSTDGSIAARYEYDPFGKTIFSEGSMAGENPYRFSTKYLDGETGLYYYGFRFYDAEMGRWINRDPVEEEGDNNLYLVNSNDCLNKYDLLGLYWEWAQNGTSAHRSFFEWLKRNHHRGSQFKYDQPLSSLGIGFITMNRPDVIDTDRELVWELKPISHKNGPDSDYAQMSKYLLETGYCPGDPKELVPIPGTLSYPILDYFGNKRDVYLYPGFHGFVYYEFGPPEPTEIKKETLEAAKNVIMHGAVIVGGIIIVIGGATGVLGS